MAGPKIVPKTVLKLLPPDFFTVFKKGARIEATKQTEKIAHEVLAEARRIVESQAFAWKPLSPRYLAKKRRKGYDLRIYLATREYIDKGIGVYKKGPYIFVGPLPGRHKNSKLTYQQLARILEFGVESGRPGSLRRLFRGPWRVPPRPLWRPIKGFALLRWKALRKAYAKAMQEKLDALMHTAKRKERQG